MPALKVNIIIVHLKCRHSLYADQVASHLIENSEIIINIPLFLAIDLSLR
jgi:hypothetical protein